MLMTWTMDMDDILQTRFSVGRIACMVYGFLCQFIAVHNTDTVTRRPHVARRGRLTVSVLGTAMNSTEYR